MKNVLNEAISLICTVVSKKTGNVLGQKQAPMVEHRLRSRMIKLEISSVEEYLSHFKKNEVSETEALISLMTTHHTFFFREFNHFEFLRDSGLNSLIENIKAKGGNKIRIWSAACSKGQEVYSLAMFLNVHLKQLAPEFDYEIIGTDIDRESIEYAQIGAYPKEELRSVPQLYFKNWWKPNSSNSNQLVAGLDLKRKIKFQVENLCQLDNFLKGNEFHLIFCRNVFIYFEKSQIETIAKSFIEHLHPDGFLFVGVSESITTYGLPLRSLGGSIYEKNNKLTVTAKNLLIKRNLNAKPYRVLVIDDSKTIHTLMKKILTREQGFEIAHAVMNGREAITYLNKHPNACEMITLDLHMPELDGIGFLSEFKDRSKPILVVSAIDREDSEGPGLKALKLGAFDYVEKPTVENLERISNEIRSKLTTGYSQIQGQLEKIAQPTQNFDKKNPKKLNVIAPKLMNLHNRAPSLQKKRPLKLSTSKPQASKSGLMRVPLRIKDLKVQKDKPAIGTLARQPIKNSNEKQKTISTKPVFSVGLKLRGISVNQVKVLIVDDSATVRKILKSLLSQDSRFLVIGESANPLEVEGLIRKLKPDLITLDIHMPELDGVTLLKKYLPYTPIPTVMISSISISEGKFVLDALDSGAVDYIQKPSFSDIAKQKDEICDRLFVASKAKVKKQQSLPPQKAKISGAKLQHGLVAIGSSTGGTEALRSIFERLPESIPPILVAQHIPAVFSKALADRLNELVKFKIVEGQNGQLVEPDHVYIAPGGKQMGVELLGDKLTLKITDDDPVNRHKPSVDYLFHSISKIQARIPNLVGVILTGMGSDGAKGLKSLKDQGAKTIGQNEASSIVYGMPKVAWEIGAVEKQISLEDIPQALVNALSKASNLKAA